MPRQVGAFGALRARRASARRGAQNPRRPRGGLFAGVRVSCTGAGIGRHSPTRLPRIGLDGTGAAWLTTRLRSCCTGRSSTDVHAAVRPHVKATVGGTFIDVCICHGLEGVTLPVHVAIRVARGDVTEPPRAPRAVQVSPRIHVRHRVSPLLKVWSGRRRTAAQRPWRSRVPPNRCSATHWWLTVKRSACRSRRYRDVTSAITIPVRANPPTSHTACNKVLLFLAGEFVPENTETDADDDRCDGERNVRVKR